MRKTPLIVLALLCNITPVMAGTSANVAVTTDYVFRGISQSDGAPAIQGGVDYDHQSGFAAGIWASSVDDTVGDAGLEVDLYASYSGFSGDLGFSLGYINYRYPGGDTGTSVDVAEVFAGLTYLNLGLTYYAGKGDLDDDYLEFKANYDLGRGASFAFAAGYAFIDTGEDVVDYKVSVAAQMEGLNFELAYTENDIDNPSRSEDSRVFLTVSKSM